MLPHWSTIAPMTSDPTTAAELATSLAAAPMPRRVVCAALRHPTNHDSLVPGPRHYDPLMRSQISWRVALVGGNCDYANQWKAATQGFIDQKGLFLTRTEAWVVASAAGQVVRRVGGDTADGGTLFSENLY